MQILLALNVYDFQLNDWFCDAADLSADTYQHENTHNTAGIPWSST